MYIKYTKSNSYKNLFFIFLLYNTLRAKFDGNTLSENKKVLIFFPTRNFC